MTTTTQPKATPAPNYADDGIALAVQQEIVDRRNIADALERFTDNQEGRLAVLERELREAHPDAFLVIDFDGGDPVQFFIGETCCELWLDEKRVRHLDIKRLVRLETAIDPFGSIPS